MQGKNPSVRQAKAKSYNVPVHDDSECGTIQANESEECVCDDRDNNIPPVGVPIASSEQELSSDSSVLKSANIQMTQYGRDGGLKENAAEKTSTTDAKLLQKQHHHVDALLPSPLEMDPVVEAMNGTCVFIVYIFINLYF